MDNDNSLLKWTGAAVGTVVVCFLLGYFILPKGGGSSEPPRQIAATPASPTPSPMPLKESATSTLRLKDVTERAEEEKRKQEEKKAAEAAAAELAAAQASPSPDPNAPTVDADGTHGEVKVDTSTPGDFPTPTPDTATPEPKVETPKAPEPKTPVKPAGDALYRVRVGDTFTSRDDAESLVGKLRGEGFQPMVVKTGKGFAVQVGAFKERKGAEEKQRELTSNGYDARIK